ncbi:MAG: hypothetical protein WD934_04725 [Gemmatimonadales bacterium]
MLNGNGSFADIIERITLGVPADISKTGGVMAPRGGTPLTDDQIRAVAAYVWTLRQPAR